MRYRVKLLVSGISEEGSIENFKASFTIRGEISVDTLMDRAQKEASNSCRKRGGN